MALSAGCTRCFGRRTILPGLMCCMFALLLAWREGRETAHRSSLGVALIATALASAFGISIYVTFAFFLVMVAWAIWQFMVEHAPQPPLFLVAGGAGALLLLIPVSFGTDAYILWYAWRWSLCLDCA